MIEKIKKYKILIVLSLACLLLLISNTVYGFDFIDSKGEAHRIPDLPTDIGKEFIVLKENDMYILAYPEGIDINNENFVFRHNYNNITFSYSLSLEDNYNVVSTYICKANTNKWTKAVTKGASVPNVNVDKYILYSTRDIIECSTGKVFFQKTPQVVSLGITQVEEIPEMVRKILIILLPVGLTVFSVLFLVYLIKSKKWLNP